ncbi:MAG: tRNA (adenosine(37)-N6)-threonylcarbamoyltransferase complex transferase subunit TsaD [Prevotellaceae bacterium]|jgi:N6-L-threonylcarbamoyladenine synthase|nr:tRNA (adenosine(37)-N6)-threonylcarbamoyltransferase complex transferase subunit TsaD [Prevotellaceae bacterium]
MTDENILILGVESSCDDTSAAVVCGCKLLSNVIASQKVHEKYGGVIPELASRVHQQNIIPVVDTALAEAGVDRNQLNAIAFTRGPGLMGSLLVGISFAKGFAASIGIPLIEINHLQGHVLSHFIDNGQSASPPPFPFLCLLVSGGHSQIIKVNSWQNFEIIGETIDDAAGEAFDKCAKIMGLPYPGGPVIDRLAQTGNPQAFAFARPKVADLNYSFSGLKTSFLYFLQKKVAETPDFIALHKADLCASLQKTIIDILLDKLVKAAHETGIRDVAIAGGVSANSALGSELADTGKKHGWNVYIPQRQFTTDNAAMIAVAGYFKYRAALFAPLDTTPFTNGLK